MWLQCMKWLQEWRCRHDFLGNNCIVQPFSYNLKCQTFTPVITVLIHDWKIVRSCVSYVSNTIPANTNRNKKIIITSKPWRNNYAFISFCVCWPVTICRWLRKCNVSCELYHAAIAVCCAQLNIAAYQAAIKNWTELEKMHIPWMKQIAMMARKHLYWMIKHGNKRISGQWCWQPCRPLFEFGPYVV